MNETSQNKNRIVYLDYLRVLAIIGVIFNHVDFPIRKPGYEARDFDHLVNVTIDALVQWSVPVLVMISGAIFLSRDIPIKKIYAKYIFRLLVAWFVWSAVYEIFTSGSFFDKIWNITHSVSQIHLWFIPTIVGLYAFIPVLKQIAKSEKTTLYFFAVAFIFSLIVQITDFVDDFGNSFFRTVKDISGIENIVNIDGLCLVLGFPSYYILGDYLNQKEISRRLRIVFYILGIIGFIAIFISFFFKHGFWAISNYLLIGEKYSRAFFLFESLCAFVFFKYCNLKPNRFITTPSNYSFGAYLSHFLVLMILSKSFGLNVEICNPAFSYVIVGALATASSFLISAFLHQIPIVKKFLV